MVFALDRGGLVGADGPTHHGAFDLAYLRCIPNMTVMAPADENECRQMLYTGFTHRRARRRSAIRAARGRASRCRRRCKALPIGRGEVRREGKRVAILAFGSMVKPALEAGAELNATVANMRFVKPLDDELVVRLAAHHELLVTVEEGVVNGRRGLGRSGGIARRRASPCRCCSWASRTRSSSTAIRSSCSPIAAWTATGSCARSASASRKPRGAAPEWLPDMRKPARRPGELLAFAFAAAAAAQKTCSKADEGNAEQGHRPHHLLGAR